MTRNEINVSVANLSLAELQAKHRGGFSKKVPAGQGPRAYPIRAVKFLLLSYKNHWFATPAGAIASLISTLGAAIIMTGVSSISHTLLQRPSAILANAICAPLLAYTLYLGSYYLQMFLKERHILFTANGKLDRAKFTQWKRVVRYDYLAHLPSDTYLIALAGIMQATLETKGMTIFWAVIASQFVDDLITFLKEPALWSGAKEVVAWEERQGKTLFETIKGRFKQLV